LLLILISTLAVGCDAPKADYELKNEKMSNDKMKNNTITLAITGDVMLGRLVNDYVILGNKPVTYVWGNMLEHLKKADLTIINLENAIAKSGTEWYKTPKVFFYRADPKAIDVLKAAKIDYVTLANNHVLDYEEEAFIETLQHLEKNNISYAGAGRNISQASKPAFLEANGIKIAIISFTDNMQEWAATETKPGINYIEINKNNVKKVKESITEAKKIADIVIVSAHWGPNMRQRPSNEFKEFAHAIIDAGADTFHGHSAHIFQGIEIYKGRLIMYDAGDLVDDYAIDSELRNDQTFLFLVTLSKNKIKKVELIPGLIYLMQVNKATDADFEEIADKMVKLSEEMGTKLVKKKGKLEVVI